MRCVARAWRLLDRAERLAESEAPLAGLPQVAAAGSRSADGEGAAVRDVCHRADTAALRVGERSGQMSGGYVPQVGAAICIADGQRGAVRAERHRADTTTAGSMSVAARVPVATSHR